MFFGSDRIVSTDIGIRKDRRHGRNYARRQAAKTTLFAAGNAGAVSKKSLAIFSNELW